MNKAEHENIAEKFFYLFEYSKFKVRLDPAAKETAYDEFKRGMVQLTGLISLHDQGSVLQAMRDIIEDREYSPKLEGQLPQVIMSAWVEGLCETYPELYEMAEMELKDFPEGEMKLIDWRDLE